MSAFPFHHQNILINWFWVGTECWYFFMPPQWFWRAGRLRITDLAFASFTSLISSRLCNHGSIFTSISSSYERFSCVCFSSFHNYRIHSCPVSVIIFMALIRLYSNLPLCGSNLIVLVEVTDCLTQGNTRNVYFIIHVRYVKNTSSWINK